MQFKLPGPTPIWLVAVSFCSLAGWGSVAILRSIPASYANIPAGSAVSAQAALSDAAADVHAADTQSQLAAGRPTSKPSKRVTCSECGVVESIREIARPEVVGRQDDPKLAPRVSGGAIVARTMVGKSYEVTVRFRDGSTTVFNEAGARTWRMGGRVIMIGRSVASN
jgi:hypothetical protein